MGFVVSVSIVDVIQRLDLLSFFWVCMAVVACQAIANIVKSSLGPVGLDKVIVHCVFYLIF